MFENIDREVYHTFKRKGLEVNVDKSMIMIICKGNPQYEIKLDDNRVVVSLNI